MVPLNGLDPLPFLVSPLFEACVSVVTDDSIFVTDTAEIKAEPSSLDRGKKPVGRVLFAFALPSEIELARCRKYVIPSHRVWGCHEMEQDGYSVALCPNPKGIFTKLGTMGWRLWQTLWLIRNERGAVGIIAVHEISALFLLGYRFLRAGRSPLVVLNVGLLHAKNRAGLKHLVWRWAIRKANAVVSLVESQVASLNEVFGFPTARSRYIPMLVDGDFYQPVVPSEESRFCLAVGTNDGKDFETLLEALSLGERLVIVTDSYNARKVRAHRCFGANIEVYERVSATDLRDLYRKAAVVAIPLKDTFHGSGHTVLLENMALGKIIIVSATRSMRGYVEDGKNALLVPVGDAVTLRRILKTALDKPEDFVEMRRVAAADARKKFGSVHFARGLKQILDELNQKPASRVRAEL